MTQISTQAGLRVLVLDAEQGSAVLLHNLLQLLPETPCNVTSHQPGIDILPSDTNDYALCFIADDYLPDGLLEVVARLRETGSGPRIFCLLNESNLSGDRQTRSRTPVRRSWPFSRMTNTSAHWARLGLEPSSSKTEFPCRTDCVRCVARIRCGSPRSTAAFRSTMSLPPPVLRW